MDEGSGIGASGCVYEIGRLATQNFITIHRHRGRLIDLHGFGFWGMGVIGKLGIGSRGWF